MTDCWSAVLSTPDPRSRSLKLKCESCLSKSGLYGFPRFIFSSVRPINLIHNRIQTLASAVSLSHFSKHSFIRLCKHDALYECPFTQCLDNTLRQSVYAISLSTCSLTCMTQLSFSGMQLHQTIYRMKVIFISSISLHNKEPIFLTLSATSLFVCLFLAQQAPGARVS